MTSSAEGHPGGIFPLPLASHLVQVHYEHDVHDEEKERKTTKAKTASFSFRLLAS